MVKFSTEGCGSRIATPPIQVDFEVVHQPAAAGTDQGDAGMPNAGADMKGSAQEPKKPAHKDFNPPIEESAEEAKAAASPDKRTWQ
jgi:hypothetical protein